MVSYHFQRVIMVEKQGPGARPSWYWPSYVDELGISLFHVRGCH